MSKINVHLRIMKSVLLIFFLCFIVFVESGVIFDNIQGGISRTGQTIRCGARKFGGLVFHRQNVECTENKGENIGQNTQESVTTERNKKDDVPLTDKNDDVPDNHVNETTTETSKSEEVVTVPGGKRILGVGANCPQGSRDDGKGTCRESFN